MATRLARNSMSGCMPCWCRVTPITRSALTSPVTRTIDMRRILSAVLLIFTTTATHGVELRPEFRGVDLKENTMLNLEVMPDAGTQLVFPFELDNPDLLPTLKIRLTNPNGFSVPTEPSQVEALLKGQNTITIEGKANPNDPGAVYLGNLFI